MDEYDDELGNYGHYTDDGSFYECDSYWHRGTYHGTDGGTYHEDYNESEYDGDYEYEEPEDINWQGKGK